MFSWVHGKASDLVFWVYLLLSGVFLTASIVSDTGWYAFWIVQVVTLLLAIGLRPEKRDISDSLFMGMLMILPALVMVTFFISPLLRAVGALGSLR